MGSFETLIKLIAHVVNNAQHLHILGNVKQPHKEYLVCFESTYKLLKKIKYHMKRMLNSYQLISSRCSTNV